MDIQGLLDLGLTEKEAQVYIALLSLGTATATELSNISDVKRTTIYQAMEGLMQKGLAQELNIGLVQKFKPLDPDTLVELSVSRFNQEKNRLEIARAIATNLKRDFPSTTGLHTQVYPLSDILSVYKKVTLKESEVNYYGSLQKLINNSGMVEVKKFFRDSADRRVYTRAVSTQSDEAISLSKFNYLHNRETVLISSDAEPVFDILFTKKSICITDYENDSVIVITYAPLCIILTTMYEHMWSRAVQTGVHYAIPGDLGKVAYPVI